MAIIDVIKYEGGNNVLVWKHPKEDFNTSAQLIVHESQEAVVFKDGQALGPYGAGKHTIETENIPGIRRIVGLVTGGITPNHYEVYYINKSYSMDVHWGTASAWTIQDPSLQIPFKMQAHGQFAVRVKDSKQMLLKLVGTTTSFTQRSLQDYFCGIMMSRIKDHISNLIIAEGLSYTELNSYLVSISEKVMPKLADTFVKYGLSLEEFVVEGISIREDKISEKVQEAMANRAVRIIEGYDKQQEMAHEVAMAQAQNQGTGGQMAQIMTGLSAGAAIAPAMGSYMRTTMQSASGSVQGGQPQRDQFSMGVVSKKQPAETMQVNKCANCGAELVPNSRFCNQCGEAVTQASTGAVSCPVCGAALPTNSKFCSACGCKL